MTEPIRIARDLAAPPEQVFRAWTVPAEIAAWYGPASMRAPAEMIHVDLRVGGRWELTMVRGDETDGFRLGYDIVELDEPRLLVLRSDPMPDMGMPEPTVVRVELEALGAGTRLTVTDGPHPGDSRERAAGAWSQTLDRLAAVFS